MSIRSEWSSNSNRVCFSHPTARPSISDNPCRPGETSVCGALLRRDELTYMGIWSFLRPPSPIPPQVTTAAAMELMPSPYVSEYLAAEDRTQRFGFEAPVHL